jgi:hypothetical protein
VNAPENVVLALPAMLSAVLASVTPITTLPPPDGPSASDPIWGKKVSAIASTAPRFTVTAVSPGSASFEAATSAPALIAVGPAYVLLPLRTSRPAPVLVSPPVPEMSIVPAAVVAVGVLKVSVPLLVKLGVLAELLTMPMPLMLKFAPLLIVNEYAGARASNWMVLIDALFEMPTDAGAPLLVKVAMSSGTVLGVGSELQLVPVVHSAPGPVQVPSTACAVPGPSIANAPMHTLPSSAARVDAARAPGAAIRMAILPIETPDFGRNAACDVRDRNRCERIHSTPATTRPGKPGRAPRCLPPPRLT